MARDATLFEDSGGSVVRAFLMLKQSGSLNIPPKWIERARESRKKREAEAARALSEGRVTDIVLLEEWEVYYRKECFYYGLRALLEMEREGTTEL